MEKNYPWYMRTVVYQIYPRSFMDSTGTGIGDLRGVIDKLDYLNDLGIETIWFSPFYPSPTYKPYSKHDCGYDIMNYKDVHSLFGDMDIFDEMVDEIHARDMKIVMDMVLNHTSIEHPWFVESRKSRDNPKRDWYIWQDGKKPNGKKPPTNWRGMTGKCWEYDELTDQWYYHAFLPFQPDLNYRNPEVREEMLDTVRFWLNKEVDGYRLDIINTLFEDEDFRDAPLTFKVYSKDLDLLFRSGERNFNHPDTLEFCKTLRKTIDEYPRKKFLVGEVSATYQTLKKYVGDVTEDGHSNDGLNLVFLFESVTTPLKARKFRKLIQKYEKWFPYPYMPTWVFGNHDQMRRISRLDNDLNKAKLNATLQLTARGVPFIYYGEEIGMKNAKIPKDESKDAVSHHVDWIPQFIRNLARKFGVMMNRDGCRTPMQWDDTKNAGFCPADVDPWLPVNESHDKRNVEGEQKDVGSLLNCYKRLLKVRKSNEALQVGEIELIDLGWTNRKCLAYKRKRKNEQVYVYLNFTDELLKVEISKKNPEILFSTLPNRVDIDLEAYNNRLGLFGYEGIIYR